MLIHRALMKSAVAVTTATLGLTLAACGGDDSSSHDMSSMSSETASSSSASDDFNQADVDFATKMIPHHAQAVQMVALTEGRTLDPAVQQLAETIKSEQTPEITTMSDWLKSWGQPVPSTDAASPMSMSMSPSDSSSMGGMDMSSSPMPGMMSDEDMQALTDASDADFQDMWLQMMQQHHEGAIEMAKTEVMAGKSPDAVALAESIISAQQKEIDQIKQLLAS